MSYRHSLYLTRTADKGQRKLDKPLRERIRDALLQISQDPENLGERLTSPLQSLYSHHIRYQGREFRIAYQIHTESRSVMVVLIGHHENFYKRLKNLLYAA